MTTFLNDLCDDFQAFYFPTGPAVLEGFQPGTYRLVLLDISLPEMDGYEDLDAFCRMIIDRADGGVR